MTPVDPDGTDPAGLGSVSPRAQDARPLCRGCHACSDDPTTEPAPPVAPYGTHGHDHTDDVHQPAEVTA